MSQSPFIRVYQRKSKSPWDDHSTVLLSQALLSQKIVPIFARQKHILLTPTCKLSIKMSSLM